MIKKMRNFKMDKKDLKILYELDMDCRQSISKIAKKVGLSKEVTNYRIRRLEKEGIIQGYYAAIDICALGFIYVRYHLWLYNLETQKEREIIQYVKSLPEVSWVVSTQGDEDLVIIIRAKSVLEIKSVCDNIYYRFSHFVKDKQIYIITHIHHFKHNYLYNTADQRREILGKKHEKVDINSISLKILNLLSKNARMTSSEIASKVGLTASATRLRIKNLVSQKIILCFRAKINVNKLGYQHFKVFLRLKDITHSSYEKMIGFLWKEPHVIYITESVGQSDLEFEIVVSNNTNLYQFLNLLRYNFGQYLNDYHFHFIYREHAINYFPADTSNLLSLGVKSG